MNATRAYCMPNILILINGAFNTVAGNSMPKRKKKTEATSINVLPFFLP